jgi:hypothetical protein
LLEGQKCSLHANLSIHTICRWTNHRVCRWRHGLAPILSIENSKQIQHFYVSKSDCHVRPPCANFWTHAIRKHISIRDTRWCLRKSARPCRINMHTFVRMRPRLSSERRLCKALPRYLPIPSSSDEISRDAAEDTAVHEMMRRWCTCTSTSTRTSPPIHETNTNLLECLTLTTPQPPSTVLFHSTQENAALTVGTQLH